MLIAYPQGWSDDILINSDSLDRPQWCDITVDSQNNVWITYDDHTLWHGDIYYTKRDSVGNGLIDETNLSATSSISRMPRISVDRTNNIHVIWRDATSLGEGVWHAKIANGGAIIIPSHVAINGGGGSSSTLLPGMTIDKHSNIGVIWDEYENYNNHMCFSKLDSLGNFIIEKIRVSPDIFEAFWPGIGVDSMANYHLGYRTDSTGGPYSDWLTYSKLDSSGNIVIANKVYGYGTLPTLIADRQQNIHIVYTNYDGPGTTIEYLKINQQGNILFGPDTISLPSIQNNTEAHMALDSLQFLHVVWVATVYPTDRLMYTKLDTAGNCITPPMDIVYPPYGIWPMKPRIAVDHSNRLHVVWEDQRANPGNEQDIYYKRGENEEFVYEKKNIAVNNSNNLFTYPNPFSNVATINLSLTHETGNCLLEIYDITGKKINDFLVKSNSHVIQWNGHDKTGNRLPAGVYFLYVRNNKECLKCTVIKTR